MVFITYLLIYEEVDVLINYNIIHIFIKFILNCGSDASLHKIITCPGLTSFSSIVKQTVSECVLECYWVCPRAFIKFNNVYEPMLGTYKH